MLPTKVEIKLKKAEAVSWGRLEYPTSIFSDGNQSSDSKTFVRNQNSEAFVESVDLGDL